MMLPAGSTERVFWAILIVLVLGYMLGTWLNRRRGEAIGRWIQAGLARFGGRPTWKILRSVSSAAQVNITEPTPPFRHLQLTYGLLTRELPPLWTVERLRGRSDTLAVRADLRFDPSGEIEVVPLEGPLRRRIDRLARDGPWEWQPGPAGLGLATRGPVHAATVAGVRRFMDTYGAQIQRLSLRPIRTGASLRRGPGGQVSLDLDASTPDRVQSMSRPHLLLFLALNEIQTAPASRLFDDLRSLARSAAESAQP